MNNSSVKSRALKIAVAMLALAIMTSCLVAGTFAKYSTLKTGTDNARAAKFGVVLYVAASESEVFSNEYANGDGTVTVKSSSPVVAPGTKGETTFSITGQPEVNTSINIDLVVNDYVYYKVENAVNYDPIKFTLWQIGDETGDITPVKIGETAGINEISKTIDQLVDTKEDAGTVLNRKYKLTWEWAFEGGHIVDEYDTILGDTAAGTYVPTGTGVSYSIELDFEIKVNVTQID